MNNHISKKNWMLQAAEEAFYPGIATNRAASKGRTNLLILTESTAFNGILEYL